MLTDKTWKPELLVQFVAGFILCVGFGVIASGVAFQVPGSQAEKQYYSMIAATLMMHGGVVCLVLGLLRFHGMTWSSAFGLNDCPQGKAVGSGLAAAIAFLPVAWLLVFLSETLMKFLGLSPEPQMSVKLIQESATPSQQIGFGVLAIVLAPVAEEMLFRGIFYTALKQLGHRQMALWSSSLLFALIHINAATFIPLTVLALMLVWLYEKTGSLLSCIAAHSFFNLVNFILLVNQPAIEDWLKRQS